MCLRVCSSVGVLIVRLRNGCSPRDPISNTFVSTRERVLRRSTTTCTAVGSWRTRGALWHGPRDPWTLDRCQRPCYTIRLLDSQIFSPPCRVLGFPLNLIHRGSLSTPFSLLSSFSFVDLLARARVSTIDNVLCQIA